MSQREKIVPGDLVSIARSAWVYEQLQYEAPGRVALLVNRPQQLVTLPSVAIVLSTVEDAVNFDALYVASGNQTFWVRQKWATKLNR